jgi:hypothetical protein
MRACCRHVGWAGWCIERDWIENGALAGGRGRREAEGRDRLNFC